MTDSTYQNMKVTLEAMYPRKVGKLMIAKLKKKGVPVDRHEVSKFFAGKLNPVNIDKWLAAVKELTDEGAGRIQAREEIITRFQ